MPSDASPCWHQHSELPLGPSISHSSQPAHRNIWLEQEGTNCRQCALWMCFRLINGHVKQHGSHFSHASPQFYGQDKAPMQCWHVHLCRVLRHGAHGDRAQEIITDSNSWFHLQLFANICITNLKTFPAWFYEFCRSPCKHRSWKSTSRATWKNVVLSCRMSTALHKKKLQIWHRPFSARLLQSHKHLYLIKHLCSFYHHSINTMVLWEYIIWDFELQAMVFQTIKAPSGHETEVVI